MNDVPTPSATLGEEPTVLIAGKIDVKKRLDAYIADAVPPHVSRSRIKALIKGGAVTVNQIENNEPSYRLKLGDKICLLIPQPQEPEPQAEDIPIEVLYEDDHLIVINKSAGMVVHPAAGNWSGTLVNALLHHCGKSLAGIGGVRRPGIVHRLDKDTSGIMVVAKTDIAHANLSASICRSRKNRSAGTRLPCIGLGNIEAQFRHN